MKRRVLTKTCRRCGTDFHPTHTVQPFCSPACRWDAEREKNAARLTAACPVCGKPFRRLAGRQTCSLACGARQGAAPRRAARAKTCPTCHKEFIPYPSQTLRGLGKFCSKACYVAAQAPRPAFIEVECARCGTKFRRTQAAVRRSKVSFCSRKCAADHYTAEEHPNFRGGTRQRRGRGWAKNRQAARERDKVCRRCGKTPEENGQALSVDHVIPWREWEDEEAANDISNLVSLCRSCHAKKTSNAERKWTKGDVLDMRSFQRAVEWTPPDGGRL